jgi:hypothetical protein
VLKCPTNPITNPKPATVPRTCDNIRAHIIKACNFNGDIVHATNTIREQTVAYDIHKQTTQQRHSYNVQE